MHATTVRSSFVSISHTLKICAPCDLLEKVTQSWLSGASARFLNTSTTEESLRRSMTASEKSRFKSYFPRLDVDKAVVTGESTKRYNCIAWTVGITSAWAWPGSSLRSFDAFYYTYGFQRSSNGPIAAWGHSTTDMTHGSISGPTHGKRWESKCGADLRIQHGLGELVSGLYGHVIAFYRKSGTSEGFNHKSMKPLAISDLEKKQIQEEVSTIPKSVQQSFEKAFENWKKTWFAGSLAMDSNPYSRARGPEFDALIALGSQVIPLIIEKLTYEDNFFAAVLYDIVQSNRSMIVEYEPDDPRVVLGEQGRAALIVKTWLSR